MIKIAVVEDEQSARDNIKTLIAKYFKERNAGDYLLNEYPNAVCFLSFRKDTFDIVFMDIEMPDCDGMTAAKKLREYDPHTLLIFVTNMRQYATKGYSVDALDFVVKPIKEAAFFSLLDKARHVIATHAGKEIMIKTTGGMRKIAVSEIRYIEVNHHKLFIHLETGNIETWDNLNKMESILPQEQFSRCNVGYLVSLAHLTGIDGEEAIIGNERLKISRPKRKKFIADVAAYFGSV